MPRHTAVRTMVVLARGARGPGTLGLAPVVATAFFPLINLPNFILASLSDILVSFILVKYPDRIGLLRYCGSECGTYGTYGR